MLRAAADARRPHQGLLLLVTFFKTFKVRAIHGFFEKVHKSRSARSTPLATDQRFIGGESFRFFDPEDFVRAHGRDAYPIAVPVSLRIVFGRCLMEAQKPNNMGRRTS